MKRNLWLLLAGTFVFVLSATLISCDKETIQPAPIEVEESPPLINVGLRCCNDPDLIDLDGDGDIDLDDAALKGKDTKSDNSETE